MAVAQRIVIMDTIRIEDKEILYRRVPNIPDFYSMVDGRLQLTSVAFNDPEMKPSVDRAKLCNSNPAHTKKEPTDGIVSLTALSIRQVDIVQKDKSGAPKYIYRIDVTPDPDLVKDNPAHARISANPDFESKNVFKKLKESLAWIASQGGWLIEPS